jgi:perosamine synthetase
MSVDFFHTHISPRARELAAEVLKSGWLSEGQMVRTFEEALQERLGLTNAVALNSGTSALHLALAVAGVGPGDEVILPAQTFVATGLVILMQGATPVFADVNPRTGNISPQSIRDKISSRTKAIMPVHWGGYPCDMAEINAIAKQHGLAVIEDAAHALGACYGGKPVGTVSRFTAFSFQAIKHLTTGDGGLLCCLDQADHHAARARRWFGIDRANSRPSILGERIYDIDAIGYKYHMNDLAAAVGLGNLETFSARLARRQQIGSLYRQQLRNVAGLELLELLPDRSHAYWLFTVLVERREDFIRKLAEQQIPASVVHLRIDHNSVFGGMRDDLSGQAEFDSRQVSIPVHEGLSDEQAGQIVAVIRGGW